MYRFSRMIYNRNRTLKDLTRNGQPRLFVRFIRYNKGKSIKIIHMTDGCIDKYHSSFYLIAIRDKCNINIYWGDKHSKLSPYMIIKHGLYGAMVRCVYGIHRKLSMRQMTKNYNGFSDYYCDREILMR